MQRWGSSWLGLTEMGRDVLDALRFGQLGEDVAQIGVGLDAVGLGGRDERVEVRARACTGRGIGEQPTIPFMKWSNMWRWQGPTVDVRSLWRCGSHKFPGRHALWRGQMLFAWSRRCATRSTTESCTQVVGRYALPISVRSHCQCRHTIPWARIPLVPERYVTPLIADACKTYGTPRRCGSAACPIPHIRRIHIKRILT